LSLTINVRFRIEQTEGAKFWLRVMSEMKNRGLSDILIAVVDGLKAFPRRSMRRFRRPSSRPALSISSAIPWSSSPGRIERLLCRPCGPFIGQRMPKPA
jgi:hypothetical protein